MTNLDLRPLSLGEILDRTFTLYRRNFMLFVGITAIPQLLALAIGLGRTLAIGPTGATSLASLVLLPVERIVVVIVSLYSQAACFLAVTDLYLGRSVAASDCLRRALGQIGTVFLVGLLTGLAVLGGAIFLIIPGIWI